MKSSKLNPTELWDQHVQRLQSKHPSSQESQAPTDNPSPKLTPKEMWDQHVERLQDKEAEIPETEALAASVLEQRTSPRIRSLNLTMYVPKKDKQQDYIISIARTLDVSQGGVKIETHRKLDRGTELELDIAIEDRIISAKGEVLRSEELEEDVFATGIRFTDISEEDRRFLR
jgi:hypothetical protein